jgi:hypothetical protein
MGVIFTLMMMSLGSDSWPVQLELKNTKIHCSDITALNMKDGYKYVGIRAGQDNYMTEYTDVDKLQAEINKQCKRKK